MSYNAREDWQARWFLRQGELTEEFHEIVTQMHLNNLSSQVWNKDTIPVCDPSTPIDTDNPVTKEEEEEEEIETKTENEDERMKDMDNMEVMMKKGIRKRMRKKKKKKKRRRRRRKMSLRMYKKGKRRRWKEKVKETGEKTTTSATATPEDKTGASSDQVDLKEHITRILMQGMEGGRVCVFMPVWWEGFRASALAKSVSHNTGSSSFLKKI
ncbi:hypothetical protein O3P69_008295 [Scylla paramamosain]|uniref:Uncharacterized protein n=1 Tax=Scylla paramamosain TaxID=85552 RepID=A0AAW0SJP2_SCYPA